MENPMDLPAAEAAKLVHRDVPELDEAGTPTGKLARGAVKPDEVFAVRVRDTGVTVITTSGERLTGLLPEKAKK